jgi:hypothetical protein
MKRSIVIAGALVVAIGTAHAQQPPPKKPTPDDKKPPPPKPAPEDKKVGTNETLQNGGVERPWAVGVSAAEQEVALSLFREGNALLNDGLSAKAAEKYREALKHWDHPAISYNLGVALIESDPIAAYDAVQKATRFGDAPLQSKEKLLTAQRYLDLLGQQIADIEVSCEKAGATVQVDGKDAFVAPGKYASKVRIGKHTFVATKSGYTTRVRAPFIGPNEHFRIDLKLYTAEELTRYKRKWEAIWVPYAVMGTGAVIAGVGGLLELAASNSYHRFDENANYCAQGTSGCPSTKALEDIRHRGDLEKTAGFVMYGVGAATVAAGGMLLYINRRQSYQIRAEDLSEGELSYVPIVTPSFAGAAVRGHF